MKKKDKFYFSHDSNARRDPKMIALLAERGYSGYGRFFALIEMLRESEDYRIDITGKFRMSSIAHELRMSKGEVDLFIKDCLDFELLESNGIFVWSNSLNERMAIYDAKRKRYSDLAKKRWSNDKSKKNEDKEVEKVSEKKAKPKPYSSIEAIRNNTLFGEIVKEIRAKEEFDCITIKDLETQRQLMLSWLEAKGKTYKNYKAGYLGWIRRFREDKGLSGSNKGKEMVY